MSTTADQLSYKRAVTTTAIGFGIQAVIAIVLLVYGSLGGDRAAFEGGLLVLLGLGVWIALMLVFHQHRLERREAAEAEAFAASEASSASVFEQTATDQLVHANRLNWLHKWVLPAVSVGLGGVYILLGVMFYLGNERRVAIETFVKPKESGWAIAIGAGVAVIGFVFARFVAGMAKQRIWSLLNGGAASAVGAAVVGSLLAVAHFMSAAMGTDWLLRPLPRVIDVFMVLIGAEMFLHFVLNLYKPRRAGEWLRPALDSRVLAFIAAPDQLARSVSGAINYQFGFNVSSTWFYRLLSKYIIGLALLALVLVWAATCITVIRPDETGLKITWGRMSDKVLPPGPVFKLPAPFAKVVTFSAEAVNEVHIGVQPDTLETAKPLLWTADDEPGEAEQFFIVQPARRNGDANVRDVSLLSGSVAVHYVVKDLPAYYRLAQDGPAGDVERNRADLLEHVISGVARGVIARYSVDDLLGEARVSIADSIRGDVQQRLDQINSGVEVVFAGISEVSPSHDAASAFEAVVAADQEREALIERAASTRIAVLSQSAGDVRRAEHIVEALDVLDGLQRDGAKEDTIDAQEHEVIARILAAGGEAARTIAQAKADRWRTHMGARSRAVRSEGQIAAYLAAPAFYRIQTELDAWWDAAKESRVFVVPKGVAVDYDGTEIYQELSFQNPNEGQSEN
ncbi:MAG: hypothetical protein KDA20_02905 [Phycisphaerales bacterium]|nr:hypothetical protein [Phycisphaerales bacterium]